MYICLGEELLIIQKEFDGFDDTNERLDLLALDKQGALVVIENKLDDSGKDVNWQALKYVSYCATLSTQQIVDIYQDYLDKHSKGKVAKTEIEDFFNGKPLDELALNDKDQRIILVAGNFRKEVTSTAMWMINHGLSVQCFKATPYHSQIEMTRKEYWTALLDQFNKVSKLFQNVSPSTDHWISCGSGVSGCVFDFIAATSYADCQLTINAGDQAENKAIFDTLFVEKDEIEKAFGGKLSWERLDEKKTCRISSRKEEVSVKDKSDWEKMIKFQCDTMPRFYDALHDRLAAAKKKANS